MAMRVSRPQLVDNIVRLAGLPNGKKTAIYFTRRQLVELEVLLRELKDHKERTSHADTSPK